VKEGILVMSRGEREKLRVMGMVKGKRIRLKVSATLLELSYLQAVHGGGRQRVGASGAWEAVKPAEGCRLQG